MNLTTLLEKLDEQTHYQPRKSGNGYSARCPAHEDQNPSLSITESDEGDILLYCHAGCSIESICQSLDITIKNLFANNQKVPRQTIYSYYSEDGKLLYRKIRVEPGKNGNKKDFYFERFDTSGNWVKGLDDTPHVLYHLPDVLKAKNEGLLIYLVEGEKDADLLKSYGLIATTAPEGASAKWRDSYIKALKGTNVVLLYDEDLAGHQRKNIIIEAIQHHVRSLKVIQLPGLTFKEKGGPDVSDWFQSGHTIQELLSLVDSTPVIKISSIKSSLIIPGKSQTIAETAKKAGKLLRETHQFFLKGNTIFKLCKTKNGEPYLEPLTSAQFASEIEEVATIYEFKKNGLEPATFNKSQAELILNASTFKESLPHITILANCPILLKDQKGQLKQVTGFDEESGILSFGMPAPQLSFEKAKALILNLLKDFHFATEEDKSRALAALLTPILILGGILPARSPLFTIEADQSQTGKGYFVRLMTSLYNCTPRAITQRKGSLGGLEESLNQRLIQGDNFIFFDNIRGKIDSPALESLMTEDRYSARIPYQAPIEIDPTRVIPILTSNKGEMTQDLANRSCLIRIRKAPSGYYFVEYPEGDLLEHVAANQTLYFGALIAIINEWFLKGCPKTHESRHDFRKWSRPLDWIVQFLFGLPPLMGGHQETQKRVVCKQLGWLRDVALLVIHSPYAGRWIRTADILTLIKESELEIPESKSLDHGTDISKTLLIRLILIIKYKVTMAMVAKLKILMTRS